MEMSLYNIANAFPQLMENEELSEEEKKKVEDELILLLQQKSQNIIGYTKNIELTIEAMKQEEKRLKEQRTVLENRVENFKNYVKDCMEKMGLKKIETSLGTLTVANNPISVEIVNENDIPAEFKETVITTKINKKAITDNFKETGEIPNGVNIITQKTSLRIK